MSELKELWERTRSRHNELERKLVDNYISFLRDVAKYYFKEGRRVTFRENQVVHWGEGNFGRLLIEGTEETSNVFGDYISEIDFEPEVDKQIKRGYIEITPENLYAIKYKVDER